MILTRSFETKEALQFLQVSQDTSFEASMLVNLKEFKTEIKSYSSLFIEISQCALSRHA